MIQRKKVVYYENGYRNINIYYNLIIVIFTFKFRKASQTFGILANQVGI